MLTVDPVIAHMAEIRLEIGRIHGVLNECDAKLADIQRSVRVLWTGLLMLAVLLTLELLASGFVLNVLLRP